MIIDYIDSERIAKNVVFSKSVGDAILGEREKFGNKSI